MTAEEEEFEFELALSEGQKTAPTPTAAPAPQPQSTATMGQKTQEVGRGLGRGAAEGVDFLSGLVGQPNLEGITPEQMASMTPQDFAGLEQKPAFAKTMDSPMAKTLLARQIPRGQAGNEGMDALTFGAEWLGGSILGGPSSLLSKANVISTGAATAADYVSNLFSDSTGTGSGTAAGLASLLYQPVKGVKAFAKSRMDDTVTHDPMDILRKYSDDPDAAIKRLGEAAEAGGSNQTLAQILPDDKGIAQLEKHFRDFGTAEGKQAFKQSDELLSGSAARGMDELTDASSNAVDIRDAAKARVAAIGSEVGNREVRQGGQDIISAQAANNRAEAIAAQQQEKTASVLKQTMAKQEQELAQAVASTDDDIARAAGMAEETTQRATTTTPTAATSQDMMLATENAAEEAAAIEKSLWAQVDDTPNILTNNIQRRAEKAVNELTKSEQALGKIDKDEIYKFVSDKIGDNISVSPQEVAKIRSEISQKLRALDKQTDPSAAKSSFYKKLNNELLEVLEGSGSGQAWKDAAEFTRRRHDMFTRSPLGKALDKGDANVFAEQAIKGGNEGLTSMESVRQIGGSLPETTKQNFIAQFSEAGKKGGERFNVGAAQSFIDKNKPALREMGLLDQMETALAKNRGAEQALGEGKALVKSVGKQADQTKQAATQQASMIEKTIEGGRKRAIGASDQLLKEQAAKLRATRAKKEKAIAASPAQSLASAERDKVGKVIGKILDSEGSIKGLKQLQKTAKKDKTGKAMGSLKRQTGKHVIDAMTDSKGNIKKDAVEIFARYREPMLESGVFTGDEISKLARNIDESKKIYATANINPADVPPAARDLIYYGSAFLGARAGRAIMKGTLQGPELGRQVAVGKFHKLPHKTAMKAMENILINPSKYESRFKRAKTDNDIIDLMIEIASKTGAVAATREE